MKGTRVKKTKIIEIPLVATFLGVAGIAGLMLVHAQETATSTATVTVPLSHTDLAAIQHYSDAQLTQLLGVLAATPLTWPDDLPNKGGGGTYWSLAHPDWPPLPVTFGAPVWVLGSSSVLSSTADSASCSASGSVFYLLDDIDYPPMPGYFGGDTNSYDFGDGVQAQAFTTNDLWLQITGTTNIGVNTTAYLLIHPPWNITSGVYDLFATTNLAPSAWQWVLCCAPGQTNLTVTNLASPAEFFILGLTNDADGDWLTDAYEKLVSKTDPNNSCSNPDGILDGWEIALGLNPLVNNLAQPGERANYGYTSVAWLNGISGVKSGTINLDNEGNVLTVSQ
jgi:hypothetical protein